MAPPLWHIRVSPLSYDVLNVGFTMDNIQSESGMTLISDIVTIYRNYEHFKTEVLVASVRSPMHVVEAAKLGAHVATVPPAVLRQLFSHPLTDKGLAAFLADWAKTGQQIA